MSGETDLERMLASLDVERRSGRYAFVSGEWPALAPLADAIVIEREAPTYVVDVGAARAAGAPVEFEAVWLTLTAHSSLEAVGLTASVSAVLAEHGIACNVIAGYYHDHLLVPADRADEAAELLGSRPR